MTTDPTYLVLGRSAGDPYARLAARVSALEAQVQRNALQSAVSVTAGQPTGDANGLAVDSTQPRLWVRRGGAWVYAALSS
jgi:hypothetical protein